jgi:hypothetical protein
MNGKSPGRFKFSLKNNYKFNFSIIIDIIYLDRKLVLYVIDSFTSFQATSFLKNISARTAWDILRMCWVDTYLGPPDNIIHDAGKNFASTEFRQHAKSIAIQVTEMPVEAHNSVGKVERYHAPLRRAYKIICNELRDTSAEASLQMAVKAVNDSAGPDGIIPTLLVFGAYPRITENSAPSPTITKRAEAICKATKEVRCFYAERQVTDALAMRNGPNTATTLELPIQSDVRVWREAGGWNGPFKLLATEGETYLIAILYGPTKFRSIVIKPYDTNQQHEKERPNNAGEREPESGDEDTIHMEVPNDWDPQHQHVHLAEYNHFDSPTDTAFDSFMTSKEESDFQLVLKLRKKRLITTPGFPFEAS